MKKILALIYFALNSSAFGQINLADSTAQTIAYWNIGEQQSYSVSFQKIALNESDTTSNEIMTYDVDITVLDSTANSYTIEWFYQNFETNSKDEIRRKMAMVAEDVSVLIETDEFGAFQRVINWEEVRGYVKKSIRGMFEEFDSQPEISSLINQLEGMYSTKQAIEAAAIQDVHQFHFFHSGVYELGEKYEFTMMVPNMYQPDTPFDSNVTIYMDELDSEYYDYVLRSTMQVDSRQLTNAVVEYLKHIDATLGKTTSGLDEIDPLTHITTTDSRIHDSGWLIYSIQTKKVLLHNSSNIEERIIQIK